MILAALALFGLLSTASGLGCSGMLTYSTDGFCPEGQGIPDCSYIQSNVWSICAIMLKGTEVVRSDTCSMTGSGGGCYITYPAADVLSVFCCTLAPPPPTYTAMMTAMPTATTTVTSSASASASASATPSFATMSASVSQTTSPSAVATRAPMYVPAFTFDSMRDFSGVQGNNGWFYGYITQDAYSNATIYDDVNSKWIYNNSCVAYTSASELMPNDSDNCSTSDCGYVAPVVSWSNPLGSAAPYMHVSLLAHHYAEGGQGNYVHFSVNGVQVFSQLITFSSGPVIFEYYGFFQSIELILQPWLGCDYGQTAYNIIIMPIPSTPSVTSTPSLTNTATGSMTSTGSPLASYSSSNSASASGSASASASASASSTATATATPTPSPTPSQTPTPSPSPSVSFALPPPVRGRAPALPQNLSELTAAQVGVVFNLLSDYKPSQIQDSIQKLGSAALGGGGKFEIETNSFKLAMKAIDPMAAQNVSVAGLQIAMPPLNSLVPGAAAAAVIQWTTNPYENLSTGAPPDSKIVSFTLLDSAGNEISAKNLSSPISMNWDLTISAGDPRIQPIPTYVLDCAKDVLYVDGGSMFRVFRGGNRSARATWSVPCLLDQWMPLNCSSRLGFESLTCPTPTYIHDCLYWDNSLSAWSSDGCTAVNGTLTGMVCQCTHLTDFSARLRAVAATNKAVFDNAARVYSVTGLRDYAQWYGVFGGLALATLLLSGYVVAVDAQASALYVDSLLKNNVVRQLLSHQPKDPIYIYNEKSTLEASHAVVEPPVNIERTLNLFQRILQQHSRLGFLFRFDPRLSRLFRLLFVFVVQFHSLFITALLYGFMHGDTPTQWYDTIVLALITMALNLPVVKILIYAMNRIGNREFKFLYPLLYVEHKRRADFELYAIAYFTKRSVPEFADQDTKLLEDKELLDKKESELLREMGAIIRKQYPYVERYSPWLRFLPAQTLVGWFYLSACFGWFGWCINYLLLFAAAHETSVGERVLTSYATSEITTVFLVQPVTILGTIFVYWLLNRCGTRIPAWIHRALLVRNIGTTPSLYYFSDPWNKKSHTSFTAEYSYNLFVHAAAQASGVPDNAYAPMEAIAPQIGSDTEVGEDGRAKLIVSLYTRLWDGWQRLGLRR